MLECGDRFDNTPLHVAAMKGHIEIVEMLLEKTVDIDRKNEDEQTPLLVAAKEGRPRCGFCRVHLDMICTGAHLFYAFPGFAR